MDVLGSGDNIGEMSAQSANEVSVQLDLDKTMEEETVDQNLISNINNVRPESADSTDAQAKVDPILAPYHRPRDEIEQMTVLDTTKTVCPECKLIIDGTIYKDGDNVMIRKNCPEHGRTIEKYWEDYDMYMKMRRYNYYGRGFDNPNNINNNLNLNIHYRCFWVLWRRRYKSAGYI